MKRIFILPLFAAAGLLVIALDSLAADDPSIAERAAEAPAKVVQQWEHLALTQTSALPGRPAGFAAKINKLGRDGWELVSVAPVTSDGTTTAQVYYFKRPL